VYDVVVQKVHAFAISSPDEFLVITDAWFYLLILIIDLALFNLKQMLEVLTAQLLGLGVR